MKHTKKSPYLTLNPFKPSGLFYLNSLDRYISCIRVSGYFFLLLSCFVEISEFNSHSVDPDQTPRSVASDPDLHCLPCQCPFYRTLS